MASIPAELQPEVERIVQKRLTEQAEAIKIAGIDKALASVRRELASFRRETTKRLDAANHLKDEMVTKQEFQVWSEQLGRQLSGVITVEQLGDGEIWVKAGVPHGLTPKETDALKVIAENQLAVLARAKFHETLWGRLAIVAGVVLTLVEVIKLALGR